MDVATNKCLYPIYWHAMTTHGTAKWCSPFAVAVAAIPNNWNMPSQWWPSTGLPNWSADWSPSKKTWPPGSRATGGYPGYQNSKWHGEHINPNMMITQALDFGCFLMFFGHPIFSPYDSLAFLSIHKLYECGWLAAGVLPTLKSTGAVPMRSLAAPATSTTVLMPEHSRKLLGGVPNPDDGCLGLIPYGYLMFIW